MPEGPREVPRIGGKEVQWQELDCRYLLLLLPAASLLKGQVDDSTTSHIIVSQGVGILDEDAFIL